MHRDDNTLVPDVQLANELHMKVADIRKLIEAGKLEATPIPKGGGYLVRWGTLAALATSGKSDERHVEESLTALQADIAAFQKRQTQQMTHQQNPLSSRNEQSQRYVKHIHPASWVMDAEAAELLGMTRPQLKRLVEEEKCLIQERRPYGYQIAGMDVLHLVEKYQEERTMLYQLQGKAEAPQVEWASSTVERNKSLIEGIETTTGREVQREMRAEAAQANNERQERDDKKRVPKWLR